ncbi:FkbM family methyltransferase [Phnomibacter ginsenosidimutans]|nr:FkbM family methyltransferase [Phnomibacter ginsenosidimutans]
MIGGLIHSLTQHLARKKRGTKLFEYLHYLSLEGLNVGNSRPASENGEQHLIQMLSKQFATIDSPVVFDVGANRGDYSQLVLNFMPNCKLYAFEPIPELNTQLKQRFELAANMQIHPLLVSNQVGQQAFFQRHDQNALSSVYNRYHNNEPTKQSVITVNTIIIDAFCSANKIREIHFLKIDAEGHDLFVLQGAKEMLAAKKIHHIQFEFGGSNIDSRTYMRDFFELLSDDFQISRVMEDGLAPLNNYHESLEIFSAANYYAQLKDT